MFLRLPNSLAVRTKNSRGTSAVLIRVRCNFIIALRLMKFCLFLAKGSGPLDKHSRTKP